MLSESLSAFVDSSPIGLMIVGMDMKVLLVNEAATEVFGYTAEELCAMSVNDLIPHAERKDHANHIAKFKSEGKNRLMGQTLGRTNFQALKKDGTVVSIQIGLNKLTIEGNSYFSVAVSDSSELIRLNRDLEMNNALLTARNKEIEQINEMQLHLMQVISHELKTPLHNTMSLVSLIRQHIPDPEPELAGWLDDLQSVSLDVVRGVRTVTDYADLITSQFTLKQESTDLLELIEDRVDVARRHFKGKLDQLRLEIDFDFRPVVWTDKIRLRRVMFGLIANAVMHAQAKEIVLRARLENVDASPACFIFEVSDNGMGIKPEIRSKIFEPMANREDRIQRGNGGLGIGLYMFNNYIQRMGGKLTVESVPGQGTVARFRVPLDVVRRESLDANIASGHSDASLLAGRNILVVDDEPMVNKVMSARLKKLGAQVTTAVNGQEALDLIKGCPKGQCFNLVLMDLDMPVMNGFEATQEIRKQPGGKHLPIFAVTAGLENEAYPKALASGMDACYSKPFDPQVLTYFPVGKACMAV